jgi:polyisoprenyl-phosphate glycosyltransferase
MSKQVDIITSALNEEAAILELYSRIRNVMENESEYSWRLIVFDNGSTDQTWMKICCISENDRRVKGFRMSRTFSLDAALTAGLHMAKGDVVILMASDLQDPPEILPELLRQWEKGFLQVLVRIKKRSQMSILRKLLTKIFYKISNWSSSGMIPENVSDFRLIDKKVYLAVNDMQERNRFMRGLISWTGFPTTYIEIDRPKRHSGTTKTKYLDLIRFSIKGILANSTKPISFISTFGFIVSGAAFVMTLVLSGFWILYDVPFAGFGTIVGIVILSFSLTAAILGIIAEYIGLIYVEAQQRPHSIIWEETD